MKKKIFILVAVLLVITIGGFYYFKFYPKPSSTLVSPLAEKEKETKLLVWEDPAGFKFSYPQEIEIDNHPEDQENYAHLELTSASHSGSILIWMRDTDYKTIEDWLKKDSEALGGQVFDTDLGGNPAKKVAFLNPKKLITATLDVDVLVLVELKADDEWWNRTYNQILETFEFIPLEEESTTSKTSGSFVQESGGGIIDEGEEIIE